MYALLSKRDLQKQAGGNPVIIPDMRIHGLTTLLCALGGEGTQPTLPPLCGWGKASCRKWLSKLKEEGEAPASGELAFRDLAGRGRTATWLISVLSLEDVLLIPGASTVYFK